ncbi:DUF4231 domain-containing protein [Demequina silvatica]|uniref:DUF4231 domain-containing protein n=1 Tax=Demequina silvatica TaxID=1638988 RepID=UPI00078557FA|nr:DUF4231 domain-containing protein [Demequina silvatica]
MTPPEHQAKGHRGAGPDGAAWSYLEEKHRWYERAATVARLRYQVTKVAQLVLGAAVPVLVLLGDQEVLTAAIAACVVVAEGMQQLFQWHASWMRYRVAAQALDRERMLFLSAAAPYDGADRERVLVVRLDALLAEENAGWAEVTRRGPGGRDGAAP